MGYFDGPKPRLFAHRGASGTLPENTLEAFSAGLTQGADRLELDVHASADGTVVVFHDATLDRCTDGSGELRKHTLEQLRALDAGAGFVAADGSRPHLGKGFCIPTLAELLDAVGPVALNIEIKQYEPAIEAAVLAELDRFGARERVLLAAEDERIMARIREQAPDVPSGFAAAEVFEFFAALHSGAPAGYVPRGAALQVPPVHEGIEVVSEAFVAAAHDKGLEVHVWTVNDCDEMRRLLALGVDGIMTDFPGLAYPLLQELGLR